MTRNTWSLIGIAVAIALSPVLAEAGTRHNQFNRHVGQRTTVHTGKGREALDMYSPPAFDSNSPATTGGGSLGYNRKLLLY